jgi:hypothetical protein
MRKLSINEGYKLDENMLAVPGGKRIITLVFKE